MAEPQSGIIPEPNTHARFLTLALGDDRDAARRGCAAVPELTREVAAMDARCGLTSVVAIGSEAWDRLFPSERPASLRPFRARADGAREAPATPGDLLIHVRSERRDLNFLLAHRIMQGFGRGVSVIEDVAGFRFLDARDLTGFVDGTENPKGDAREEVALVSKGDAAFSGGSYVSLQRYVHDLARWEGLAPGEQESIIGRTKDDDRELEGDAKPPTAHISRVVIQQDGEELEILRRSMPYGDSREAGLVFLAFARTPEHFDRMLDRMIMADEEGHHDHLLDYTRAVTGLSFFAPSLDFLRGIS